MEMIIAQSCPTLCDPMNCNPAGFSVQECSEQECWSWYPFLFPGVPPNSGSNSGLPHCRQILYHLRHQGNLLKVQGKGATQDTLQMNATETYGSQS